MKSKPSRGKDKPKKYKSFSDLHGSKSDMFNKVSGEQLGHGSQLPSTNPPPAGGSPLLNPGQAGHPMGDPGRIGIAMGDEPRGPEYY